MGKKMLHLPPFFHRNKDFKTKVCEKESIETEFAELEMENYEIHASEIENEEIDELAKEVGRIFHQELDMREKDVDSVRFSLWKAMRYLADIVLNILIMLLPILLSIMTVGFLIKGGKVFLCRLTDLWGKTGNKRNF
jgi:hypothetical protein